MNSTNASNVFIMGCLRGEEVQIFVHKFPTQFTFISHVAACFFSVLTMLTTITLNSLTFATFWWSPRMRKSISLFLIMILSGVDAVAGLLANSMFTLRLASEVFGTVECWMLFVQRRSSIAMTICSLGAISVINMERYIGVVHPIYHHTKLQKSTLLKFLILSWIVCAIILGLSFYNFNILVRFATISYFGFMLLTVFAYTCIGIKVIATQRQRMTFSPSAENHDCQSDLMRKEIARFLKELKFAKSCFMIVTSYVLCFAPVAVFLGAMHHKLSDSNTIIALAWCVNLAMLSFSLDSLIFFWRNRQLRRETIIFLKRMIQCNKKVV